MVFSTNQARHFYVANTVLLNEGTLDPKTATPGTIKQVVDEENQKIYYKYIGHGGQMRSDLIDMNKILYVTYTKASKMKRALKTALITLDADVNEGKPVVGQDYIISINFRNYFGPSDTHTYLKQGVARAFEEDASKLYARLAISLAKNFSRELVKPIRILLQGGAEVTATTKYSELSGTYTGIILEELPQPWTLGIEEATPVNFEVSFTPIVVDSNERIWGKVVKDTEVGGVKSTVVDATKGVKEAGFVHNGQKIADMEYFYMKERGDQYGNIGWPNVVPTKYLVDPSKEYEMINIHYSYIGANEGVQKSEKDLTIVGTGLENLAGELESAIEAPCYTQE